MPAAPRFPGFPKELPRFLAALAKHNEKAWFDAHRDDYEALYVEPAKALVVALAPGLAKLAPGVRAEPRIGGSIMRIHRDTRFSKDKTPYKTALHLLFTHGEGRLTESPGFFLRIAPEGLGLGAGQFHFDKDRLAAYRKAAADPKIGRSLRAAIEKVRKAGPYELPEPHYKRVPRGFDADGPNADLLRQAGLSLFAETKHPAALFRKDCTKFFLDRFRELRPIPDWIAKQLGT